MTTSSHSPGDEENALSQPPLSRTVRLAYGREAVQFGELHLPGSPGLFPTVILIHGGFWRVPFSYSLMTSMAEDLANRVSAPWNIEYLRVGGTTGRRPTTLFAGAMACADLLDISS